MFRSFELLQNPESLSYAHVYKHYKYKIFKIIIKIFEINTRFQASGLGLLLDNLKGSLSLYIGIAKSVDVLQIKWFLRSPLEKRGDFALQGTFDSVWRHFCCHSLGTSVTGIQWVEVRHAAKHPAQDNSHNEELFTPNCQQC